MLLKDLNKEQLKAVTHQDGPLLIVAGAGTGKTAVITQRIGWLIEQELAKPDELLALTFTDKAAGEMEERVDRLLPYGYVDLWIMTFHSICQRVLERYGLDIGLSNEGRVLDETEQQLLIRKNFERFHLSYYKPLGNPTQFIGVLLRHFSRCKDEAITSVQYAAYAAALRESDELDAEEIARVREVAGAYQAYEKLLLENGSYDFGDLLVHALRLFTERAKILEIYRKQFKYILVDEFQDTNFAQYALVKLLAGSVGKVTVVGDDDQSIYKFRGASVSNILQFQKDFPQAARIFLQTNYRSKQEILDKAYEFIQLNNPDRLEYQIQQTHKPQEDSAFTKRLTAHQGKGAELIHLHARDAQEEALLAVKKIRELVRAGASYGACAILVRANAHADRFTAELDAAGIPYHYLAAKGLYRKPVIRDLFAYAQILDAYHESPALYHIATLSVFPVLRQNIAHLTSFAHKKGLSLFEACTRATSAEGVGEDTLADIATLLRLMEKHRGVANSQAVREVFLAFLEDFGYLTALGELSSVQPKTPAKVLSGWVWNEAERQERAHTLAEFFREVAQFTEQQDNPTLKNFLDYWKLKMETGDAGTLRQNPEEASPDRVAVMTVHAAKGLEFDHVFIGSLVDKHFPSIRKSEAIPVPDALIKEQLPNADMHLQEERRLMYVAMTRAKKGLYFLSADDYGGKTKKKLSRFLVELGYGDNGKPTSQDSVTAHSTDSSQKKEYVPLSEMPWSMPQYFSFTQLRAYQKCPLQYKYAHILQVPVRGKPAFSFGKSMHAVLQKFFQERMDGTYPDETALLRMLDDVWIDDWYAHAREQERAKEKARKELREFYNKHDGLWPDTQSVEKGFHLKFAGVTFKGSIDRIDLLPEGKVRIIDYKTGKPKDKLKPEDKEQLFLYQLAAQDVLNEQVAELAFVYLEDVSEQSFIGGAEDFEKLEKSVSEVVGKIQEGSFVPTPSPFTCASCDYKDICPYRK